MKINAPNWSAREFDVFLALADTLSFRRTALQMHLSQLRQQLRLQRAAKALLYSSNCFHPSTPKPHQEGRCSACHLNLVRICVLV